jgi:gas vesicle protein
MNPQGVPQALPTQDLPPTIPPQEGPQGGWLPPASDGAGAPYGSYGAADVTATEFGATEVPSTGVPSTGAYSTGEPSTPDVAKEEAGKVKDTALEAGQNVAGVAKQEAGNVVAEGGRQAKNLLQQFRGEVQSQASTQQSRLAEVVHGFAKELGSMASGSDQDGPLTDIVHQASRKGGEIGHWLESHEPSDLVAELKRFARRRPGTFLAAAVVAGVLAGRLGRGLAADSGVNVPSITGSDGSAAETYVPRRVDTYDTSYSEPPASLVTQVSDDPAVVGTAGATYPPLSSEPSSWTEPARTTSYE